MSVSPTHHHFHKEDPVVLLVNGAKAKFRDVNDDGRSLKLMRQPSQSFQCKLELSDRRLSGVLRSFTVCTSIRPFGSRPWRCWKRFTAATRAPWYCAGKTPPFSSSVRSPKRSKSVVSRGTPA